MIEQDFIYAMSVVREMERQRADMNAEWYAVQWKSNPHQFEIGDTGENFIAVARTLYKVRSVKMALRGN